jgi:hypothetical protein
LNVAFDIGGVISKYPDEFRRIIKVFQDTPDISVYVITDMHDRTEVLKQLKDNNIEVDDFMVYCADYEKHGEFCKAVLLRDLRIDVFFDDFAGYVQWDSSFGPAPIRLQVMPNGFKPYWSPDWKCSGPEFGRRVYKKENDNAV